MLRHVIIVAAGLAFPAMASAADPITMFVLQMLSNKIINAAMDPAPATEQRPVLTAPDPSAANSNVPPQRSEQQRLRALVDDSFMHLTPAQRDAVYASLVQMLNDPKNAPVRAQILTDFTLQANAYRNAYRQLSRLSLADKQLIAAQARDNFTQLPQAQRRDVVTALESGVPGLPRDLGDMILAEFRTVTP